MTAPSTVAAAAAAAAVGVLPFLPLYQSFNPDTKYGLARLIELLVYIRGGVISISTLTSILHELNDGIVPIEIDYYTFIEKHCSNISFLIIEGSLKCKFKRR